MLDHFCTETDFTGRKLSPGGSCGFESISGASYSPLEESELLGRELVVGEHKGTSCGLNGHLA